MIRYVVLNPVRARMVRSAGEWPWSSYRATAGLEQAPAWLDTDWTLQQFHRTDRAAAQELYREFVAAGAGETRSIWEDLRAGLYLGTDEFGAMLARLAEGRQEERAYPREHRWPWRPPLPALVAAFAEMAGTPLCVRSPRTIDARRLFAAMARDRCGAPVEEIADLVGLTGSGATKLVAAGRALIRQGALSDLQGAVESKLQASRPEPNNRGEFRT